MKIDKLIILLSSILLLLSCSGNKDEPVFCGSEFCSEKGMKELIDLNKLSKLKKDTALFRVNIWIATKKNADSFQTKIVLDKINIALKDAQIQLKLNNVSSIDPVDFTLDELFENKDLADNFKNITRDKTGIQIIILPKGKHLKGLTYVCKDNFDEYSKSNLNTIYIHESAWLKKGTILHELGHFFGLQHTFGKDPKENATKEKTDQSNCNTAGDFICDTRADPNGIIDSNCEFVGLSDGKKHDYNPPIANYMSYYKNHCRSNFTKLQLQRMALFARKYRSYLVSKN